MAALPTEWGGAPQPADASAESLTNEARWRALQYHTRRVWVDRNADGFKKRKGGNGLAFHNEQSKAIRDSIRPLLREAIRHLKSARRALRVGDVLRYELSGTKALLELEKAAVEMREVFMHQEGKKREKLAENNRAASPRPPDLLVVAIRNLMHAHREMGFKPFLAAWLQERKGSLRVTLANDFYEVVDEDGQEGADRKRYKLSSLGQLFKTS